MGFWSRRTAKPQIIGVDYNVRRVTGACRATANRCGQGRGEGDSGKLGVEPLSVCNRARLPQSFVCSIDQSTNSIVLGPGGGKKEEGGRRGKGGVKVMHAPPDQCDAYASKVQQMVRKVSTSNFIE
jgi:hypothetical protein